MRRPVCLGHREGGRRRREAVPLVGDRDSVVVADGRLLSVNGGVVGVEDQAVSSAAKGDVDRENMGGRSGVVGIFGRGEGGEGVETLGWEARVVAKVTVVEGEGGGASHRRRVVVVAVMAKGVKGR